MEKHDEPEGFAEMIASEQLREPGHREAVAEQTMNADDAAHELDRLNAWRDTQAWLKLVEPMREHIGRPIDAEALALAFYAVRRLESGPGSATRSRVLAATRPDADLVMELHRATDHAMQIIREERDALRKGLDAITKEIRRELFKSQTPSVIGILEQLDSLKSTKSTG
jgi:hypothetical protein